MQPYFLPYIGYFQLIQLADAFVVYDNIKYTRKGWINRNRMLVEGKPALFTLPIKHASDSLEIAQRELADEYPAQAGRILRRFEAAYREAPFFTETMALVRACLQHPDHNLFHFILHSLRRTVAHLGITTPIIVSSTLPIDPSLQAEDRVIATCRALGATEYINPPGGRDLYNEKRFAAQGLALRFLEPVIEPYQQFGPGFVTHLSVADTLMFNAPDRLADIVRSGRVVC